MAGTLNEAIKKLEQQRAAIERALSALREVDGAGAESAPAAGPHRGRPAKRKGGISAEGRKRLSEALKARWAAKKADSAAAPLKAKAKAKRKGGLTAAGRKKLSDALKARWAAKRASAKKGR